MANRKKITVMVVDDHPVVRNGLIGMVDSEDDMEVVAEASDGVQAVQMFTSHRPDVTLMDLKLPRMSGAEAVRAIRELAPAAHCIVLTTFDGDEDIHRALKAGAQSYLLKDSFGPEIISAIRTVYGGSRYFPADVAELMSRDPGPPLTEREMSVLKLIAKGRSNREIAGTLHITEATVKSHLNTIFSKLGVEDRTQAALVALERGIVQLY